MLFYGLDLVVVYMGAHRAKSSSGARHTIFFKKGAKFSCPLGAKSPNFANLRC